MAGKFRVGDRVRVNASYDGEAKAGETGTVTATDGRLYPIEVRADVLLDGIKDGLFFEEELDLLDVPVPAEVPC